MIDVKITFENGDTVQTGINCKPDEADAYYLGNVFNLGSVIDNLQTAVSVEVLGVIGLDRRKSFYLMDIDGERVTVTFCPNGMWFARNNTAAALNEFPEAMREPLKEKARECISSVPFATYTI